MVLEVFVYMCMCEFYVTAEIFLKIKADDKINRVTGREENIFVFLY